MTVTTKQIETIKFQIEFMVMMQNCGRLEEAQESMLKISTLLEQLIGVEVVHWLRRDLFEELEAIRKETIMKQMSAEQADAAMQMAEDEFGGEEEPTREELAALGKIDENPDAPKN